MIPVDISIIGMVFTLILFIIFFSAIVLYIAFRIKETFRSEARSVSDEDPVLGRNTVSCRRGILLLR